MLKSPYLLAISVLLTFLSWATFSPLASASTGELGLSFDLSPVKAKAVDAPPVSPSPSASSEETYKEVEIAQISEPAKGQYESLPVPAAPIPVSSSKLAYIPELLPPISTGLAKAELAQPESAQPELAQTKSATIATAKVDLTESRDHALKDIGLNFMPDATAAEDYAQVDLESPSLEAVSPEAVSPEAANTKISSLDKVALSFAATDLSTALKDLEIEAAPGVSTADKAMEDGIDQVSLETLGLDDWIFQNGSNSLVARTVGSAEGTRHWQGDRTTAYYGHVDPGNGVWNLGTFSYQHGASSPEEADEKQLQRLKRQGSQIEQQAAHLGVKLSLEEKLNALDLANQAPLAALDRGGYIERLAQAHRLEMKGEEAILWARTYAYLDPDTRAWNAPGLGNNIHSISKDQERRIAAISKALKAFEPSGGSINSLDNLQRISLDNTHSLSADGLSTDGLDTDGLNSASAQSFGSKPLSGLPDLYESFLLPPKDETPTTAESTFTEETLEEAQAQAPEPTENPASESAVVQPPSPSTDGLTAELPPSDEAEKIGVVFIPTEEVTHTVPVESAEIEGAEVESAEAAEDLAAQDSAMIQSRTESQPAEANIFSLSSGIEDTDAEEVATEAVPSSKSQEVALSSADISETQSEETTRQQRLDSLLKKVLQRDEDPVETKASGTLKEHPLWRVENTIPAQN
ncbi:MAG: hypothetical protein WA949_23370 [Phormidesmis sp.]